MFPIWEQWDKLMRIISRKTLDDFRKEPGHRDAAQALLSWIDEIEKTDIRQPKDVKALYGSASFLAKNRVVFNIAGNKYRLVVAMRYEKAIVYVKFIGTHQEYVRIDAVEVQHDA
jgi:mRNA interferase HigB